MQLKLRSTDAIQAVLRQAAGCPGLSQELQAQAQQLLSGQEVPWRSLRDISQQLHAVQPKEDSLSLHEACRGSQLVLSAPPKREKSKELLERLSRLQQQVDQNSYNKMVAEVTQQERAAEALRSGALQTYKQQISFGLHVIVMMGTFYAVGYIAGTALSPNMAVRAACGLCGLVLAMLLETVLLMIETNRFEAPSRTVKAQGKQEPGMQINKKRQ